MATLTFPHKKIRSQIIKVYMANAGYKHAICFSCGNASRELRLAGVDLLDISPIGDFIANRWFTPAEVHRYFPDFFDATSGHLPLHLMLEIAEAYKEHIGELHKYLVYDVPTGSGETLVCLKLAYPDINFVAQYNLNPATEFSEFAPLNEAVNSLAYDIDRRG